MLNHSNDHDDHYYPKCSKICASWSNVFFRFIISVRIIILKMASPDNPASAAINGQEALYNFLLAWQESLNIMSSPRVDPAMAADQLQKVKDRYLKHFAELESAAATIDAVDANAESAQVTQDPCGYITL